MAQMEQIPNLVEEIVSTSTNLREQVTQSLADAKHANPIYPDLRAVSQIRISAIGAINELNQAQQRPELYRLTTELREQARSLAQDTRDAIGCIESGISDDEITRRGLPDRRRVNTNATRLERALSALKQGPQTASFYTSLCLGSLSQGVLAGALLGVGGLFAYETWSAPPKPTAEVVVQNPRILPALAEVETKLVRQLGIYNDYLERHKHALPESIQAPVEVELSSSVSIRRTLNEFRDRFAALRQSEDISPEAKQLACIGHPACDAGIMCWDCSEQHGIAFMIDTFPKFHH